MKAKLEVIMPLKGFPGYKEEDAERYSRFGWWLGITLSDMFDKASDLYPNREALVDEKNRFTYAQLRERVDRRAIGLMKLSIKKKDRVRLPLLFSPENQGDYQGQYSEQLIHRTSS